MAFQDRVVAKKAAKPIGPLGSWQGILVALFLVAAVIAGMVVVLQMTGVIGGDSSGNPAVVPPNGGFTTSSPADVVEPTVTVAPTDTPEPTDMPTLEPTPTVDWSIEEMPLSYWEENFSIAQSGDPNVSLELAACVQFNEEFCVRGVDYCPEGTECVGMMSISPVSSFPTYPGPWSEQPGVMIGANRYAAMLWQGESFATQPLFTDKYERDLFVCMLGGHDQKHVLQAKMLVPVNKAVFEALSADGERLFIAGSQLQLLTECLAQVEVSD